MKEKEIECPFCQGDGEFITEDDCYICNCCEGLGYLTKRKLEKYIKENDIEWKISNEPEKMN